MTGRNYGKKAERNREICQRFHDGETLKSLARRFGMTQANAWRIVSSYAPLGPDAERQRRIENCRRYLLTPEMKARADAGKRRLAAEGGWRAGRKKLFGNDPEKRGDYLALREAFGAAYAREAMGLAA